MENHLNVPEILVNMFVLTLSRLHKRTLDINLIFNSRLVVFYGANIRIDYFKTFRSRIKNCMTIMSIRSPFSTDIIVIFGADSKYIFYVVYGCKVWEGSGLRVIF